MKYKKILVCGGAGFIGSTLAIALKNNGYEVQILDKRDFTDVLSPRIDLSKYIQECDLVFHLANIPAHRLSVQKPRDIIYNNYNTTLEIVELCRIHKKKLIYASSFSVYGKQKPPWKENMQTSGDTPYAHAKVASEQLLKLYSDLYQVNIIVARFSNVFGEMENLHEPPQVLPIWFDCLKNNKPLVVNSKNLTRDFTYVGDIVNGLILLMEIDGFDIYNICSGKETNLYKLAKKISNNIKLEKLPKYEASKWYGENKKIKKLGWKPSKNIFDYVEEKKKEIKQCH